MFGKTIKTIKKLSGSFLTSFGRSSKIPKTSDTTPLNNRDISKPSTDSFKCPYCRSTDFVKRGFRKKLREKVQLYLCNSCGKTFTQHITKGKHYPLEAVLDGLSLYNSGHSLEAACKKLNNRYSAATLANWLSEFVDFCPFSRMRYFALKKYSAKDMVLYATLAHQQFFKYRFHRAKCYLAIVDDYRHRRFWPLKEFLELVPSECPHQFFQKGLRASESPIAFSKKQMIVRAKKNYAVKLCKFVLQSVKNRRKRHDALEKFFLYNDSCTVATEVPVYLTKDDLLHLQTQLGFELYKKLKTESEKLKTTTKSLKLFKSSKLPRLITGHIDILQVRNGQIHILDYKPKAEKNRPIEQLTLYAMALSRLTGLRIFDFKCAWFDENDYFEFYPLHVLHKPKRKRRRRKVKTKEGTYLINKVKEKMEKIRPFQTKNISN